MHRLRICAEGDLTGEESMSGYRCYFLNGRIIEGAEPINAATDQQAMQEADRVFREKAGRFSGFEVCGIR
jgi:hypothetical protein